MHTTVTPSSIATSTRSAVVAAFTAVGASGLSAAAGAASLGASAAAPALDQETDEGQECVHGGLGGGRAEADERAGQERQPRQGPAAADRLHDAGQIPAGALC